MPLKLVNFFPLRHPDTAPRVGALTEAGIIDLAAACVAIEVEGDCLGSALDLLICDRCLQMTREAVRYAEPNFPLSAVRLLAPVLRPGKLLCVAGNYEAHIAEGQGPDAVHPSDRATPRVFMKPTSNTVCGPDDPILIGRTSRFVDWEGELAVIIGKRGKYIPAAEALEYVAGVTCFNDVSERRLKVWERPEDRPQDRWFDWLNGKWTDNSAPMGPGAVPLADIGDLQNLKLQTRVNGQVMQDTTTAVMIFSVARLIEYISHILTLEPGDVIATGTPSGVGAARDLALQPGDVVEVEIEGIGILRNPVASE